jgi:tetratricopeptide (TPR) repeat protein
MTRAPYRLAVALAALAALAAITYPMHDPDIWQHLAVGRTLWQSHAIPTTQVWTWPTFGAPDVLPSWLFRALVWPFWEAGGLHGLYAWRWLATLAAFGLALLAARRMGATGVAPLVMLAWCVLFWRQRAQVRPETLAGVLLAAEILLLEARRSSPAAASVWRDRALGLVPIALLWANAHISYYLGFVVSGGYLLDDLIRRRQGRRPGALAIAILLAALASLANPFGWRALAQPLEYFTVWRHEPVFQTIGELSPIYWDVHVRDGLAVWLALVVLAALARWRARGFDAAQATLLAVCLPQALLTQRFLGYAALALAPFAARDAADWLSRRHWPAALQPPVRRAALASLASVLLVLPTLAQPYTGFGYGWVHTLYPERASDWIAREDVRGRSFNVFSFGGYLLYRFHPDPGRLPFMDIHQAGTREIRYLYAWALQDSTAWRELDRRYRFDWVLLPRVLAGEPDLSDFLDADPGWALVFADDAAALWLRRDGSCAAQARAHAFRHMPGGTVALGALGRAAGRDTLLRRGARAEFARAIAASPWNARAHTLAGNLGMIEGDFAAARAHYDEAARQQPHEPELRPRQGLARLHAGDPAAALESFRTMRRMRPGWPEADLREGQAFAAMGRREEAIRLWRRSLERQPQLTEARDSLARAGAL